MHMKRNGQLTIVLGVAAAVAGASLLGGLVGGSAPPGRQAVAADVPASTNGIVVDGLGRATGTPDVLRVTLGVTVRRGDVSTALSAANARQERVAAALRHRGVAAKDLQTSEVNVGPWYDNKGRQRGYQVTETLTAKLRDLGTAGRAISDAVVAGGDEATLQGVSFALEDNAALLVTARDAAYAEAKAKAERYAQLSGRALGEVQLVAETSSPVQPIPYGYDKALARTASAVPINPGTQDVSVSVTVRWALR
jgi:uncharacterized protein